MRLSPILRYAASEPPAMAALRNALKLAMKAGNAVEKNTLRSVMSAVKNANIAKSGSCVTDLAFAGLISSLSKKRLDAAAEYLKGSRSDLADNEKAEAAILDKLLESLDIAKPEEITAKVEEWLKGQADHSFKSLMANLPKDIESQWKAPKSSVVAAIREKLGQRSFSTMAARAYSHDNPLGLRRRSSPPQSSNPNQKRRIKNVNKVILVSSAKGGVGKSTVSVNLASALASLEHTVGVLDVDIFGPSLPHMLGLTDAREPELTANGQVRALQNFGIKAMSMGFLIPKDKSVSWRGLLIQKALEQLLFEVEWGPGTLDYLVVDMPPGTGDIQLTIAQKLKVDGSVLVTTPQDVALIDVKRGLDLFNTVNIPVLGLVQNMSVFICPHCNESTEIFGPTKTVPGLDTLAHIPLLPAIAATADAGRLTDLKKVPVYVSLAEKIVAKLAS